MRIALDTNLLISLVLVSGGRLDPIWRAWKAGRLKALSCEELQCEVEQVLARPDLARYLDTDARQQLLRDLELLALRITLSKPNPECEGPNDRFLLALAHDGHAGALITGDHALQALGQHGTTLIVSPADLVTALESP